MQAPSGHQHHTHRSAQPVQQDPQRHRNYALANIRVVCASQLFQVLKHSYLFQVRRFLSCANASELSRSCTTAAAPLCEMSHLRNCIGTRPGHVSIFSKYLTGTTPSNPSVNITLLSEMYSFIPSEKQNQLPNISL